MNFKSLNYKIPQLKQILNNTGLTVLKDLDSPSDSELIEFATQLSEQKNEKILHWNFGPIMKMQVDCNAQNYLFSAEKVPLHWDGAFFKVPQYLLFYCDHSDGNGGETYFVNTNKVYSELSPSEIAQYQNIKLTYKTEKLSHYGGEFSTTLFANHPITKQPIIRFAEKVETELNPVSLIIENTPFSDFYEQFKTKLYQSKHNYSHSWNAGDLLIVDNYTFLHGRQALGNNLKRQFRRVQIL